MEQQGSPPVDVAILVEPTELRGEVVRIVTGLGWKYQTITVNDLKHEDHTVWDLVIISVQGSVEDRSLLVRAAAREVDSRVVVIANDPDPRNVSTMLESGADDYVLEPLADDTFAARVTALVDRARAVAERRPRTVAFIYPLRTITFGSMHITFAPREWDVLMALLDGEGRPMSLRELAEAVWGDSSQQVAAISTVSRVRSRLKSGQFHVISVHTHRGRGYSATIHRPASRPPRAARRASSRPERRAITNPA